MSINNAARFAVRYQPLLDRDAEENKLVERAFNNLNNKMVRVVSFATEGPGGDGAVLEEDEEILWFSDSRRLRPLSEWARRVGWS